MEGCGNQKDLRLGKAAEMEKEEVGTWDLHLIELCRQCRRMNLDHLKSL